MQAYYLSDKLTLSQLALLGIDFDYQNLKSNIKLHVPDRDIKIFECQLTGLDYPKKLPKTDSIIEILIKEKPIIDMFDSFDQIEVYKTEFIPFIYFRYKILLEMGITLNDIHIYEI
jgi:hypothetical protein